MGTWDGVTSSLAPRCILQGTLVHYRTQRLRTIRVRQHLPSEANESAKTEGDLHEGRDEPRQLLSEALGVELFKDRILLGRTGVRVRYINL